MALAGVLRGSYLEAVGLPSLSAGRPRALEPGGPFPHRTEQDVAATKITVVNNGPLRIEGDFEIVDQDGNVFGLAGRTKLTLCRCGHSARKPFCDGTHKTCGVESVVVACDLPAPVVKPVEPPAA